MTDYEAPEADYAEQHVDAEPVEPDGAPSTDPEAPEWDAVEQSRSVQGDDEYR
ncbi:hypothetical protein AB0M20_18230 [Actinoplanes sp. NPDC051633]|uniref:hypothetical protein n=1 Tax=Actinoplanes sp. NPDC051633 TaxID=3155670 RepID=UPI003444FE18